MLKSFLYMAGTIFNYQHCQMSAQRLRLRRIMCALKLVVFVFLMLFGFSANATDYEHRIALLIGLGKYEVRGNKGVFRNLPMVVNDLETVAIALREIGFDKIDIYSDQEPPIGSQFEYKNLLSPSESLSTRINSIHLSKIIYDRLSSLEYKKNTLLLIYFTGHGGLIGKSRVLVTPDSDINNPDSFQSVYKILFEMSDHARSVDKMIVIDACADELIKSADSSFTKTAEELPVHIYSSGLNEASYFDDKLEKSIFTYYFASALTHADDLGYGDYSGIIDSDKILNYVKKKVPTHSRKEQKRDPSAKKLSLVQHPWGSGSSNIVLTKYPKTPPLCLDANCDSITKIKTNANQIINKYYGEY